MRSGRPVEIEQFEPLQIIRYLFRLENLLLIAPFIIFWSFLFLNYLAVGEQAGHFVVIRAVMGLFLSLALYICYLLLVLDYTARGYQQPPKVSGDLIDQNKARFFKAVLALSVFASFSTFVGGSEWTLVLTVISALILPVVLAIIAIQESFSRAMNPWNWVVFISDLKLDRHLAYYLVCFGLLSASLHWLFSTRELTSALPAIAATTMLLLALFRSIGILVHANAESLGLPVRFGESVERAQQALSLRHAESDLTARLYRLSEADKTTEAFAEYQQYVKKNGIESVERLWPVISLWANPRLALLAGQQYIEQLVNSQSYRRAWEILIFCFTHNNDEFKLLTATATLKMCDRAETKKEQNIAAELLKFFSKDFPNHPEEANAALKAIEFLLHTDQIKEASRLLREFRIRHPDLARKEKFEALSQLAKN